MVCTMDIFKRKSLSSKISNTLDAIFCVDAPTKALCLTSWPEIINTDRGSQLPSVAFFAAVTASGAKLSMEGDGGWTDNISGARCRSKRLPYGLMKRLWMQNTGSIEPLIRSTQSGHTHHLEGKHQTSFNHQHKQKVCSWHHRKSSQHTYF